jgi:hypothetical protein
MKRGGKHTMDLGSVRTGRIVCTVHAGCTQIEEGFNSVDWKLVGRQISESLEEVDWDEIGRTMKEGFESVNWKEVGQQISDAFQEEK